VIRNSNWEDGNETARDDTHPALSACPGVCAICGWPVQSKRANPQMTQITQIKSRSLRITESQDRQSPRHCSDLRPQTLIHRRAFIKSAEWKEVCVVFSRIEVKSVLLGSAALLRAVNFLFPKKVLSARSSLDSHLIQ
jgi:hypothetical protein